MTSILRRERQREIRETHRGEGDVKLEVEAGSMGPQVEECWQPAETGRCKDGFSPRASRRSVTLLML